MSLTVTATQGTSVANGMALRVVVLNGAATIQNGATTNNHFAAATSWTQSITTTQTGSRVYGAGAVFGNNSATAAALTTVVDNISDAVNTARYVTFKAASLTGTPGPTTLGFTVASSTGPFAQAEILSLGLLNEDNSAPAVVSVTGATTATTASFNPPAGSLLVALVAAHGGAGAETMTVSGGGLTWTEQVKNDPAGGDYAGVWIARVPFTTYTFASGRTMWSPGALGTSPLSILTTSLPNGTIGVPYSAPVVAVGGNPAYTWSISAGSLPGWASLSSSTGVISGTPTGPPATTSFTVEVTDANLNFVTQALSITTVAVVSYVAGVPVQAKLPPAPYILGRPGLIVNGNAAGGQASFGSGRIVWNQGGIVANPSTVTPIGTPVSVTGTTSPVTGQWGTGQSRTVNDTLVAVVTFTGTTSVTATAQNAGTSGWIKLLEVGSSGTALAQTSIWYKVALGNDAAPAFTSTITGTGTSSITLYQLRGVNVGRIAEITGTTATGSSTITATTVTTTQVVYAPGGYAVAGFCRERASVASNVTMTAPFVLDTSDTGTTKTGHFGSAHLANPVIGSKLAATVNYSGAGTTAQAAAAMVVFPGIEGPPFRQATHPILAQDPLVRANGANTQGARAWRGRVYSNQGGPVSNPPPPALGPPVYPLQQPVKAKAPLPLRGKCRAILSYSIAIPVVPTAVQSLSSPIQARIPQNAPRGRIASNRGAPVHNPTPGPVFRQKTSPVQARRPLPARGRVYGISRGAPVSNPTSGPVFRQATQPVRVRIPQVFSKGRTGFNPGGPVRNPPVASPPVRPQGAVRAKASLPRRGTCRTIRFYPGPSNPLTQSSAFIQAVTPIRARIPQNAPRGRIASNRGAPVSNPTFGPAFRQAVTPARARIPQVFSKGRAYGNAGGPVQNPGGGTGPTFYPKNSARARIPRNAPRGRVYSNKGAPVQNPTPGPVFRQKTSPARIRPSLPHIGRISSNPGSPVQNPPPPVAVLTQGQPAGIRVIFLRAGHVQRSAASALVQNPTTGPVFRQRASQPPGRSLPRRGTCRTIKFYPTLITPVVTITPPPIPLTAPVKAHPQPVPRGRISSNPGGPVQNAPPAEPAFVPKNFPIRARIPQNGPRGRVYSNPGAPVRDETFGPVFTQRTSPARARQPLPLRGRIGFNPGGPVQNPGPITVGPVFYPKNFPVRARIPQNAPRGRVYSNKGEPVQNETFGPVFRQAVQPVRARIPQVWSKGRVYGNSGGPVRNPPPPVYPLHSPVQARIAKVFSKGRTGSNPGQPAVNAAIFRQLTHPVQARIPLPPRGRIGSNRGGPVRNPSIPVPVPPLQSPVRARFPLPPRGRVAGNRGGPVRNQTFGPRFIQAVQPIRTRIPQNGPRGRTGSNPGGPVENIPTFTAVYKYGVIHFEWTYGDMHFQWAYGDPHSAWEYGEIEGG